MIPQLEIVQKYLSSSKFRKAKDWYAYDYSKYLPYISEHKDNPKFMYCQLTRAEIPKIPEKVEVHVKSKRYQRRLAEAEEKMKKKKERAENEASFWIPPGVVEEEEDTAAGGRSVRARPAAPAVSSRTEGGTPSRTAHKGSRSRSRQDTPRAEGRSACGVSGAMVSARRSGRSADRLPGSSTLRLATREAERHVSVLATSCIT